MPSHRTLRIAEAIREVVSSAILFEVADPRVRGITVLRAEVTGDLRNATVFVTVMGSPQEQAQAMKGLQSAASYIQRKVAARLQTRFTPALAFKRDEGVKKQVEMSRLIDEAIGREPGSDEAAPGPVDELDDDLDLDEEDEDGDELDDEDQEGLDDEDDDSEDEDEDEDDDEDDEEAEEDAADGDETGKSRPS